MDPTGERPLRRRATTRGMGAIEKKEASARVPRLGPRVRQVTDEAEPRITAARRQKLESEREWTPGRGGGRPGGGGGGRGWARAARRPVGGARAARRPRL